MKAKILYVEDDESLGYVTKDNLELQGYELDWIKEGTGALKLFGENSYDLCILDVMLPGVDGFSIAKEIRDRNKDIPIIFLSAKSLKEDKLYGLKLGADDYITKPYSIEELILKIEVFLRRSKYNHSPNNEETIYNIGFYKFDYDNFSLAYGEEEKKLTKKEADLLLMFVNNSNCVIKREEILKKLWGKDDYFMGRSLDVFISRLRKYLNQDSRILIENIHGVGFRMKITNQ